MLQQKRKGGDIVQEQTNTFHIKLATSMRSLSCTKDAGQEGWLSHVMGKVGTLKSPWVRVVAVGCIDIFG
jgi:hypothetical protein